MDDGSSFLFDQPSPKEGLEHSSTNFDTSSLHDGVEELFKELHGISVEELEVELRRKEKELYLCSKLGLFLAQEVDELVSQRRGIVSDHTRLLLELQEYRDSRRSYLDVSDGASERAGSSNKAPLSSSASSPELQRQLEGASVDAKVTSLQSGIFNFDAALHHASLKPSKARAQSYREQTKAALTGLNRKRFLSVRQPNTKPPDIRLSEEPSPLGRTASIESLDLISNAESTMTSASTRDLQNDLDLVQESHDRITKLEVQLDNTRAKYRSLMTNYSYKLKDMSRQLGSSVTKARPYFEAVKIAKRCHLEAQQAAVEYKRAVNLHKAARDMVKVAEERVMSSFDKLDPTWQEMLNQANLKVNDASKEKNRIHREHMAAAKAFQIADDKKMDLKSRLQRSVIKSKPYFEIQKEFQSKLESVTKKLNALELRLMEARQNYSHFLTRLKKSGSTNKPSEALKSLSERGMGVGAENPHGLPNAAGTMLPKPAFQFLEKETVSDPMPGCCLTDEDEVVSQVSTSTKTKLHYSPYDLLYLSEIASDSGSHYDSEDNDYIQDF